MLDLPTSSYRGRCLFMHLRAMRLVYIVTLAFGFASILAPGDSSLDRASHSRLPREHAFSIIKVDAVP